MDMRSSLRLCDHTLLGLSDGLWSGRAKHDRKIYERSLAASAMTRASCSRSSGVKASPKSSAPNTGRISISLGPGIGLGQSFTHATRLFHVLDLPQPKPGDELAGFGEAFFFAGLAAALASFEGEGLRGCGGILRMPG